MATIPSIRSTASASASVRRWPCYRATLDPKHISTSFVERQNLTLRMSVRRFTRLTNAHSKKLSNHEAAIAFHYMHYNFCRIHQSLRVTPAMEAGLAHHVWTIEELVGLLGWSSPFRPS